MQGRSSSGPSATRLPASLRERYDTRRCYQPRVLGHWPLFGRSAWDELVLAFHAPSIPAGPFTVYCVAIWVQATQGRGGRWRRTDTGAQDVRTREASLAHAPGCRGKDRPADPTPALRAGLLRTRADPRVLRPGRRAGRPPWAGQGGRTPGSERQRSGQPCNGMPLGCLAPAPYMPWLRSPGCAKPVAGPRGDAAPVAYDCSSVAITSCASKSCESRRRRLWQAAPDAAVAHCCPTIQHISPG